MTQKRPEANTFWMVWREGSDRMVYKHHSRKSADDEAKRLARQVPGAMFYVLKSATAYQCSVEPVAQAKMTAPCDPYAGRDLDSEVPF